MNHQTFQQLINLLNTVSVLNLQSVQENLKVNRDVLHSYILELQQLGLSLICNEKDEISLPGNIQPLDLEIINSYLSQKVSNQLVFLPFFLSLDSTNQHLKTTKAELLNNVRICLAEHQTNGRGRQSKQWISPLASNIYLSLHINLKIPVNKIGGISLIVGISIINGLNILGLTSAKIKWPNDIYWNEKKLAGILIESTKIQDDDIELIIGIGININMPDASGENIDQPWIDLNTIIGKPICRNNVIAVIIEEIIKNTKIYEQEGLSAFMTQWKNLDYLFNKSINVKSVNGTEKIGQAVGVNEHGELLMEIDNQIFPIHAGDISVRKVSV